MILKDPKQIELKLRNTGDGQGRGLDENIIRPCVILNALGYKTRQSCEGHVEEYGTYPWIDLIWDEKSGEDYYQKSLKQFYETIFKDLEEFYKLNKKPYDNTISFSIFDDEILIIRLAHKTDSKIYGEERPKKLQEHLKEIQEFCEYLNKKYHLNY